MQLLLEYLLNCQESQFKTIKDNNHRLSKSKLQIEKLKRDSTAMKEDIKIYQRQLNMLKHALSKSQGSSGEKEALYKQAPKVVLTPQVTYATTAQSKDDIIDSILLHEKETRAVMSSILDEQREMFLKQMSLLTANLKSLPRPSQQDGDATKDIEFERNRKMEEIISVQMNQTIDRLRGELQVLASSANRSGHEVALQELRSKELQMAEKEMQLRGAELEKREQQLQFRAESMNITAGWNTLSMPCHWSTSLVLITLTSPLLHPQPASAAARSATADRWKLPPRSKDVILRLQLRSYFRFSALVRLALLECCCGDI